MGAYKNKGSLIYQVKSRFRELDATGQKKATDPNNQYIHSFETMKTYLKHSLDFATYCRKNYGCKIIEECRPYVKEFIENSDYSTWVKKAQRSAIAKLYGVKSKEFGDNVKSLVDELNQPIPQEESSVSSSLSSFSRLFSISISSNFISFISFIIYSYIFFNFPPLSFFIKYILSNPLRLYHIKI